MGKFLESQFHRFILFCCWYGRTAFVHELVKQVKKKGRTEGGQYSHWSLLRLLAIFTRINHLSRPRNPISLLHSISSNCWSNLFLTFLLRWPLLLKRPSRISRRQSPKCRFSAERKGCRNFFFLRRFQICLEKQAIWRISANWPNIQLFFSPLAPISGSWEGKDCRFGTVLSAQTRNRIKGPLKIWTEARFDHLIDRGMISTCLVGEVSTQG